MAPVVLTFKTLTLACVNVPNKPRVEIHFILIVYYQQMHLVLILFSLKCLKQ
jgi:hypothetical protein